MDGLLLSELELYIQDWFRKKSLLHEGKTVKVTVEIQDPKPVIVEVEAGKVPILKNVLKRIPAGPNKTRLRNGLLNSGIIELEQITGLDSEEGPWQIRKWKNLGFKMHKLFAEVLAAEGVDCYYTQYWSRQKGKP